jgi:lysophospholipase L1-like esterase
VENPVESVAPSLGRGPGPARTQALVLSPALRTVPTIPSRAVAWARVLSLGVILAVSAPWAPADTAAAAGAATLHWVVSWGAGASPPSADPRQARAHGLEFQAQTLRQVVHLSLGGPRVRVRVSNLFGSQDLEIGAAHLALRTSGAAIAPASDRPLTFGGRPGAVVPPNAVLTSDPVDLTVSAGADLAVSLYLPHRTAAAGVHYLAQQTSYSARGDQTAAADLAAPRPLSVWAFLAGVDVAAPEDGAAIAAFGDSLTDGDGSTENANARWPDALARRLAQAGLPRGVLNAGIAGNRVLHDAPRAASSLGVNALARFDRDALDQPGVRYVILFEGNNDFALGGTPFAPAAESATPEALIAAVQQLIGRAHDRGIKVIGATLPPFQGADIPGYASAIKDQKRQVFNRWVRTAGAFDAVLDVDQLLRDPAHPERLNPALDSGDHLHPGDDGYKLLAGAIDLALFK